jgi:hypothetical protein
LLVITSFQHRGTTAPLADSQSATGESQLEQAKEKTSSQPRWQGIREMERSGEKGALMQAHRLTNQAD